MIVEWLYSSFKHTLNKSCLRFTGIDPYSGWNVWICVGFVTYTLMWACDTFIQDTEQALSARIYAHQIRYKWRKKNSIVEYSSRRHKRTFWSTYDRKICDRRNTQENNMICIACFYKLHRYAQIHPHDEKNVTIFFKFNNHCRLRRHRNVSKLQSIETMSFWYRTYNRPKCNVGINIGDVEKRNVKNIWFLARDNYSRHLNSGLVCLVSFSLIAYILQRRRKTMVYVY